MPAIAAPGFSAGVDLDLTDLLSRLDDESQVVGEVIARLVAACRHEQLIDDGSVLQVVKLTADGAVSPTFAATTPRTLTVVLNGTRVHAVGDWGWGGLGVVTLGRIVRTLVSAPEHGLSITQRSVANLGFTVRNSSTAAHGVVRVLDEVARSVEGPSIGS